MAGEEGKIGIEKFNDTDIRDLILSEEVRRKAGGETSTSGAALNLETRGRGHDRNSGKGRSKSRKGRSKIQIWETNGVLELWQDWPCRGNRRST
jgi:hypothetical protein